MPHCLLTPLRSSWHCGLLEGGGRSRAPTAPGPVSGGLGGPVLCVCLTWGRNQLRVPTQLPGSLQVLQTEGSPLGCSSHPPSRAPPVGGGHSLHGPLGNDYICISDVIHWLLSPTMYFSGVLGLQCGSCSPADILLNLRSIQPQATLGHTHRPSPTEGSAPPCNRIGFCVSLVASHSGSVFRCWAVWLRKPVKGQASRSPVSAAGHFCAWLQ